MTDSILHWNEIALEANRVSHTDADKREQNGPTLSSRALAIVHLAMYDAYAKVRCNPPELPPYMPNLPPPPPGASTRAAVAAAAYRTLVALYPAQKRFFDEALERYGDPRNPGHECGIMVADRILEDRRDDPDASDAGYKPSQDRFRHRVDPDNPRQGFHAPFYGARSKGFAVTRRHELEAPPRGDSEYVNALQEVRAKGIAPELTATLPGRFDEKPRTPEETTIGIYWAYDGAIGLGTPPRLYNQIVRRVALVRNLTEDQNARLFALVNAAMGDAGILAWDQKYCHDLWRPVVGIREHDPSFGPHTKEANDKISDDADPFWLPLGSPKSNILNKEFFPAAPDEPPTNRSMALEATARAATAAEDPRRDCERCLTLNKNFTPNFPAYPSGHAAFGAAALHITRLFCGVPLGNRKPDDLLTGIDFVSDELNGETQDNRGTVRPRHRREFDGGLWQMIVENGLSRVFLGVHWVFDAFKEKGRGTINPSRNVGGVPLGLTIAEDIFQSGLQKSPVGPRTNRPPH